jgi:rhomboid protease GluP
LRELLRRSPLTAVLLVAIAAAFAAETALGGSTNTGVLVYLGANVPELVVAGQWWRLFTAMFLHIGVPHLLLNGYALYQLGGLFESWMGSARMGVVYVLSGLAGSVASLFFLRRGLSAGASGAIFGLLGALVAVLLKRRERLTPAAKQLLVQLVMWAGINVVFGLTTPGIDNAGHFGGAVAGFLLGLLMRPRWERAAAIAGATEPG